MGYHITLARPTRKPEITQQEWCEFVLSRSELTPVHEGHVSDSAHSFDSAILDGREDLCLHYAGGTIFTKNPTGPRIIEYMASISAHFGGVVTGDEGETFSSPADWGTQSDWNRPLSKKSFWKREFTPGNIIRMMILLLVTAWFIYLLLFARH